MEHPYEELMVRVPRKPMTLLRLVSDRSARSFRSRARMGRKARLERGENWLQHHGISAFSSEEVAFSVAWSSWENEYLPSGVSRWNAVAEFVVAGKVGHAFAETRGPNHYTVWGEAEELFSTVVEYRPIPTRAEYDSENR